MQSSIFFASARVGFDTLRANPLRTILSTLGIVIGVAALVSVLSIGDGMERLLRQQIGSTTDLQRVAVMPRLSRLVDGTPFPVANPVRFTSSDASALAARLHDSATVNLSTSGSALVTSRGDTTPHPTQVTGTLVASQVIPDSMLVAGRTFSAQEASANAPMVVVSERLANDFRGSRPAGGVVGDTLLFQGMPRIVIGVSKDTPGERARHALMPFGATDSAVISSLIARPATMVVSATIVEAVGAVKKSVEDWAAASYGAAWKDRVTIAAQEARLEQITNALRLFKLFVGAIMSISLVVGGVGIMNVLLSSVIERTREIGIRKATGASQHDILWQFLVESVAITGVGSLIGLILGVLAALVITAVMRRMVNSPIQAWLSPSTVIVAIGASVVVGVVFGLYPAMRAARLSPIDAIHHE